MEDIIKNIHDSETKLLLIEAGAGMPIANELFSVPNSSNTVYYVESPYSKESFEKKYGYIDDRAVSPKRLKAIKDYYLKDLGSYYNTIMATTFQIGDEANKKSSHGWIMLSYNEFKNGKAIENTNYYHISIHEPKKRKEYIKMIGEIGILLLNSKNKKIPENCLVDIVLDKNLNYDKEKTLKFISKSFHYEQASVFTKNGFIQRLEHITRNNKKIIYYKGSFRPIQKAHKEAIKICENLFKDAYPVFAISIKTFGKGNQEIESLLNRINLINNLGYDVVVLKKPLFLQNLKFIRNKFKGKIIFPMGLDTINRLIMDYIYDGELHSDDMILDFSNAQIICLNRTGNKKNDLLLKTDLEIVKYIEEFYYEISSTDVRKHLEDNNFKEVKKLVPKEVYKEIIKNRKKYE